MTHPNVSSGERTETTSMVGGEPKPSIRAHGTEGLDGMNQAGVYCFGNHEGDEQPCVICNSNI